VRRRIVMLSIAAVLALLSAVAVVAYARGSDRRAVEGKKGTWVLLATATIPSGTTGSQIRSKRLVRQVLMPAETVPSGALTKLDTSFDSRRLNAELRPDQMLLSRQFESGSKVMASPSPTFTIPAGLIAVSVELGIAPQVAGNVRRGDKVSVFVTAPKTETEENPARTWVVLPRTTVVSVGEAEVPAATPSAVSASGLDAIVPTVVPSPTATSIPLKRYVVTLAVTGDQAEQLINAYNRGYLHLGLLGSGTTVSPAPVVIESGPAA
jgi:pilus assembly protein CpaB